MIYFFEIFTPVIILHTLKLISSILFGTHILPNGSSTVSQLPSQLSRLIMSQ